MNRPIHDNSPEICSEVGLSCETCTAETARQVAAVCKGLHGKAVGQVFVQIYPSPGCAPMHKHFAGHYQAASAVSERREAGSAHPRAMAAVA